MTELDDEMSDLALAVLADLRLEADDGERIDLDDLSAELGIDLD